MGRLILEKLPLLGMSAAASLVTLVAQGAGGAMVALEAQPLALRLENALVSYGAYLLKTLCRPD